MTAVVFCNRYSRLESALRRVPGPSRYLNLSDSPESLRICEYLHDEHNAEELPRAQLLRDRSEEFRKEYIEFMGRTNAANHSLEWWAMPLTNKDPVATDLCRITSHLLLIVDMLRTDAGTLVVVTDSLDLAHQIEAWGRDEGVTTVNALANRRGWKSALKERTPVAVLLAFLKALWIWALARSLRPSAALDAGYTVVTSLIHVQSLAQSGTYRDVYFGRLIEDLRESGERVIVFGMLQEQWRQQLGRLRALTPETPVVPVEGYLTLWDLMTCALKSLKEYLRPVQIRGPVEMMGIDLHELLKRAIHDTSHSGNTFMSLRIHYATRRLASTLRVTRCLYPYENLAWEKMMILGFRSASPETRLVGYQHASLTQSHTNFILQKDEAKVAPLPDMILTTGEVLKAWLEKEGNYPPDMFKAACALRQSSGERPAPRERTPRMNRVLVALATSLGEYVNTLTFLGRAFTHANGYEIRVRPHPTIPLEAAQEMLPSSGQDTYSPSTGPLPEDLQWADVVLYASSTVGLEATSLGIPTIYLNLGDILDTDPMFGWSEFKWAVKESDELIETLKLIEGLDEAKYRELQHKGRRYVEKYLTPATAEGLHSFLSS